MRKLTTEEFVRRSKETHGDTYDYSLVEYERNSRPVNLICKTHGPFCMRPDNHMMGKGCNKCGEERTAAKRRLKPEEFISKAREVHGDVYDYSSVDYKIRKATVTIICKIHGAFEQKAGDHLSGRGCSACGKILGYRKKTKTTELFVKRAKVIHGDKYDYSKTVYLGRFINTNITCRKHGEFVQVPGAHLAGNGCPKCGQESRTIKQLFTTEEFINRATKLHKGIYGYDKSEYISAKGKVIVTCPVHGEFEQVAFEHYSEGCGCPKCAWIVSKPEIDIREFLAGFYEVKEHDRETLDGKEIDILIKEKKLGIEYNGTVWHSEKFHKDPVWHMRKKQLSCEELGIRLIHISDKENTVVVKKTLAHMLGLDPEKYYARKCGVVTGKASDVKFVDFFNKNHLQGAVKNGWVGALTINNQIVCAMIFSQATSVRGNMDEGLWELRRFASACRVTGGASRLLRLFIRNNPSCREVVSYSDNRWFTGEMYERLGFSLEKELRPDYKYFKGQRLEPKNHFKRSVMAAREGFEFNPAETEHENCLRNGWYRIYDCGKKRWRLKIENPLRD